GLRLLVRSAEEVVHVVHAGGEVRCCESQMILPRFQRGGTEVRVPFARRAMQCRCTAAGMELQYPAGKCKFE
ncbi:MAG: hypothetical protein ACTHNH_20060, partial [Mesorhizobium sp.]